MLLAHHQISYQVQLTQESHRRARKMFAASLNFFLQKLLLCEPQYQLSLELALFDHNQKLSQQDDQSDLHNLDDLTAHHFGPLFLDQQKM